MIRCFLEGILLGLLAYLSQRELERMFSPYGERRLKAQLLDAEVELVASRAILEDAGLVRRIQ